MKNKLKPKRIFVYFQEDFDSKKYCGHHSLTQLKQDHIVHSYNCKHHHNSIYQGVNLMKGSIIVNEGTPSLNVERINATQFHLKWITWSSLVNNLDSGDRWPTFRLVDRKSYLGDTSNEFHNIVIDLRVQYKFQMLREKTSDFFIVFKLQRQIEWKSAIIMKESRFFFINLTPIKDNGIMHAS